MDNEDFVIFYAWQSDSPASVNRNFIESVIKKAINNVKGIIDKSPRLDKDTKDVPGIPDIANTILEKIRNSDVFLADLSFVGTSCIDTEPIPNPNVMIELGYALSELGGDRIITVINTHYGTEENLPFDLRNRRWPISYKLSPDDAPDVKKEVKQELTKKLFDAITSLSRLPQRRKLPPIGQRLNLLEDIVGNLTGLATQQEKYLELLKEIHKKQPTAQETEPNPLSACEQSRESLVKRIREGNFENLLPDKAYLVLVLCPEVIPESPLDIFGKSLSESIKLQLQPLYATGWHDQKYGNKITTTSKWQNIPDAVTEINTNGIVSAAGHEILVLDRSYFQTDVSKEIQLIPALSFEKSTIEAIGSYGNLLRELRVDGNINFALGLINLGKSMLYVGIGRGTGARLFEGGDITPPAVAIPDSVDFRNLQNVAKAIRPALDFVWREYNYPGSLNFTGAGDWVVR